MGKLTDAAKAGKDREALEALRDLLAERVEADADAGAGTTAQIAAQLRAVLADIRSLPRVDVPRAEGAQSGITDIASAVAARADRVAKAKAAAATKAGRG